MVYDVRIWADSFAYPATEVTSAAMPSPMPQGSLSETACNRVNTFFGQSLTCILRRYLDHQNIPIKHQTSTIMAACLGSCTATNKKTFLLTKNWTFGARNRHELQGPPTVPQPQTLTRAFSWALREWRTPKKQ